MKINYQSDFKLIEKCEQVDQTAPFKFIYSTQQLSQTSYVASFDGKDYYNCRRLSSAK